MKKLITGNLDQRVASHPETNGWFLGCFMAEYPDFQSDNVELKWVRRKKGEKKSGLRTKATTKTLNILISGKLVMRFPELNQNIVLSKLGDFAFYDARQTSHEVETLKDSLFLVVRYPSKRRA